MSGTTTPVGLGPGTASDFIFHLRELGPPFPPAVLYARVSGREQQRQRHLEDQVANLKYWMACYGVPVVSVFKECAAGWERGEDRPRLMAAQACAAARGAVVVAESADRLLRHRDYDDTRQAWPTVADFMALTRRAGNVRLATVLHPDAPFDEVQRFQQHRQRPAQSMELLIAKIVWYKRSGMGPRRIAKVLGMPEWKVRRWLA